MDKGGIMRKVVIAVAAVVSLVFALTAFAIEEVVQPPKETGGSFEQMKANHLKKLDERMNSLQEEKTCAQAAKNREDLITCRSKHKSGMKGDRDEMRKSGGAYGMGGQVTPPVK
jgi:hypothetical protein